MARPFLNPLGLNEGSSKTQLDRGYQLQIDCEDVYFCWGKLVFVVNGSPHYLVLAHI